MQPQPPAEIPPDEGPSLQLGGFGVVFKVGGEATGGSFSVVEHPIQPGTLIFPHAHRHEDEHSFVVAGHIGARVGDHEIPDAGPGSYVLKPRGVAHAYWNAGPGSARVLDIISPAGFEKYFEELAELFAAENPSEPDVHKLAELIERYGLAPRLDWVAELEKKYGVSLNRPSPERGDDD
ncbi:MAG: cupin domain-containing protein [Actinomycetota bacterium]|nr:cupin domain-containing protein [Actinomycetota bacterium]